MTLVIELDNFNPLLLGFGFDWFNYMRRTLLRGTVLTEAQFEEADGEGNA